MNWTKNDVCPHHTLVFSVYRRELRWENPPFFNGRAALWADALWETGFLKQTVEKQFDQTLLSQEVKLLLPFHFSTLLSKKSSVFLSLTTKNEGENSWILEACFQSRLIPGNPGNLGRQNWFSSNVLLHNLQNNGKTEMDRGYKARYETALRRNSIGTSNQQIF